ncbi:hypothetical protein H310_08783 [Aphanomyces invadans]|uniref:Uncharacterized protein n=1 Tax=Aphanomyces invadans TaxID=157072 RepID=A0A024TWY7_9STRA|nr:hypothetical protein H310_08783 [Aphanomyces invadans]ETV98680.1 hypothetical protein H310_08783 [Aphanomyces invadans]|eukprot:XP_008872877.1 hypothetical protein H310_08783 [Aphanomyces invadans]
MAEHHIAHPLHSRGICAVVFGYQRGFTREFLTIAAALRAHNQSRRHYTSLATWTATVSRVLRDWLTHVDLAAFARLHGQNASLFDGVMHDLACVGRRDLLEYLYHCGGNENVCSPAAVDCAARAGHLDCVQFFTHVYHQTATTEAMDHAACNGFDAVVRYLHQHRREGCTHRALDWAAKAGHLSIVQFLVDHVRTCCCHSTALDIAAASGFMDIVAWLHPRTLPYQSTDAVDGAAAAGDLTMVDFLLKHRQEGASGAAFSSAVAQGRIDILRRLLAANLAVDVSDAIVIGGEHGHFAAVALLTPRIQDWRPVMRVAATRGTLDVVTRFVLAGHVDASFASVVGIAALCQAAATGNDHDTMAKVAAMSPSDTWIELAWRNLRAANDTTSMARLKPLRRWWRRALGFATTWTR